MNIQKVRGLEILDANGIPTLECHLILDDGFSIRSSVPSGLSRSKYEAFELRDENDRLYGKGVSKARSLLEGTIAPLLLNKEPNVIEIDQLMLQLDGTDNKTKLGANTMLAVSIAVLKAQAYVLSCEVYELVAQLIGADTVTLPFPLFNMISGGKHSSSKLSIQEFLILPSHAQNFREGIESALLFSKALQDLLEKKGFTTCIGTEGAFTPLLKDNKQALDILQEVIESLGQDYAFKIALDMAASQFFDAKERIYKINNRTLQVQELIEWYQELIKTYPIFSIEDGLSEDDWQGWKLMMETLGESVQLVGDDICATNPARVWHAIEQKAMTAVIIKPNQIGTITEALQAIQLGQEHDLNIIVSHRSQETNDSIIADIAVGTSAGQFKAGGCARGEHIAKYNRLLEIEDQLMISLLET